LARLKAANARRALFFCAFVGMPLANIISAQKKSRREVGGHAQRLQAGVRQRERVTRGHILPPPLTSFERFQLDGECLLVSIVALCGAPKLKSLTPLAIGLSSAAVVENYYVAHLACLLPYAMKSCAPSVCTALP
jgi:hypothetical protein